MLPFARMLYALHDLQRRSLEAVSSWSAALAQLPVPWLQANAALLHRSTKSYGKPELGLGERVVLERPFCRLLRVAGPGPRVLVIAPLSGHHASLVRDTVASLREHHDVYLTDWRDARDVPLAAGTFSLDDYVAQVRELVRHLGDVHVIAVCQPTVPALAAVSLDAADGAPPMRSLTLMGGPIDARIAPTVVDKLATDHPIEWFERHLIHTVPAGYAGAGRRVYPGFLQLAAFVMMNPDKHASAYWTYWLDSLRGDTAATAVHEKFYDEYNAVLDMDAPYYLDTVRVVFQEFALAKGTWRIGGQLVEPAAITRTPLFAVEGEHDDISAVGQTAAAFQLAPNAPVKRHLIAACGHYGLFSGSRWRETIYPEVRAFIQESA